jgi:hypothetical protein
MPQDWPPRRERSFRRAPFRIVSRATFKFRELEAGMKQIPKSIRCDVHISRFVEKKIKIKININIKGSGQECSLYTRKKARDSGESRALVVA